MVSPVLQALANIREENEPTAFGKWCVRSGFRHSVPAEPAVVAAFVMQFAVGRQIDEVWQAVREVSRAHLDANLADPTAGGLVQEAINLLSNPDTPHSWPPEMRDRLLSSVPFDVQRYIIEREKGQTREIRRAQREAAELRKQLGQTKKEAAT